MAFDEESHPHVESLPPPPPPKTDVHFSTPPQDLPPIPSDDFNAMSMSLTSPASQLGTADPFFPPLNGTSGGLLTPPSPNPAVDSLRAISPSLQAKLTKKTNPLTDLVESEREYIDVLAGIIRKVAGAWSRTNFPPKQLDAMFRGIEAIYKANKGLLIRLKEIGPTPTSPKALGDLLMRWIDDLDIPYTKFCSNYATGFDAWDPVVTNTRLPPILTTLSSISPPSLALLPSLAPNSDLNGSPAWTLDTLFSLPRARLKYYKKLYTRLLKSTQPGRSDHKLLTGAVEKLESLLSILAEKEGVVIGEEENGNGNKVFPAVSSRLPLDPGDPTWTERTTSNVSGSETTDDRTRGSVGSSLPPSSISSEARTSRDTIPSNNASRVTSVTMTMPISNLEKRLSTERVLDIFTLKPKAVRLQMNPPSLPFTRLLRISQSVEIHFTPRAAPDAPRIHAQGHIFLLTDLFLICERMTPDERIAANSGTDGKDYDMWLLYPPLAGKHLRVSECPDQNNALQIQVLKKEMLFLHTDSTVTRDSLIREFKDCIEAANLLSPRSGQPPPPPVPPIMTQSLSPLDKPSLSRDTNSVISPSPSPRSVSNFNTSPRSWDQPRLSGEATDASRQVPTSSGSSLQSPSPVLVKSDSFSNPSPEGGTAQGQGARIPFHSASQPQLHLPASSGSSQHLPQIMNTMSPSVSTPFPPSAQGTNDDSQYSIDRQPGPPKRPVTAPGHPQYGAPPFQSNYPPQMQTLNSFYPRPPSNDVFPQQARPPSDPMSGPALRTSPSASSMGLSQQQPNGLPPPMSGYPTHSPGGFPPRDGSVNFAPPSHVHQPHPRLPFPPPLAFNQRTPSLATTSSWGASREPSPPSSPIDDEPKPSGPVTSTITAQFKCKVFLQLHHGQWKSLGGGKLKLYLQQPTNVKQLVVEADSKDNGILISTIVLTDGVERVGRTGVAIELSDKGARTGIIYMIQLRNDVSASGLFDSLLAGSDRAAGRPGKGA